MRTRNVRLLVTGVALLVVGAITALANRSLTEMVLLRQGTGALIDGRFIVLNTAAWGAWRARLALVSGVVVVAGLLLCFYALRHQRRNAEARADQRP